VDEFLEANRRAWDEKARIHLRGHAIYPIGQFKAGSAGTEPDY
jgi:hypothetical protein